MIRKKKLKKWISAFSVFVLLISLSGLMTFAAQDPDSTPESTFLRNADLSARTVSETIVVNANALNGNQEYSLEEDVSVKEGDGIDLYATEGYKGKISAKNIDSGWYGAWVQTSGDGSSAVLFTGSVVSENGDAVFVTAEQDASAETTVNGNLTSESGSGLNAFAVGSATVSALLNGDINASGGMNMNAKDMGRIVADGTGDVSAQYTALYGFSNNQSEIDFSLEGNVSSEYSAGIVADAVRNSNIRYTITGSVNAAELGAELHAKDDSTVVLSQTGNLSGSEAGLFSSIPSESGKVRTIVDGTVYGENAGILFDSDAPWSVSGLDLLVWKIETGDDGYIAADRSFVGGTVVYTENEGFERSVQYIIKTEQPAEGVTVYAVKADGSPLDKKYADEHGEGGYEVASEGDIILLKLDVQPGYSVKGAYNGTTPLQTDASGNYYLQVARGGGIYLSVDAATDPDGGDPDGGGAIDGGDSDKPSNIPANKPSDIPQTGDNNTLVLWITLFAVSLLAAIALLLRKLIRR